MRAFRARLLLLQTACEPLVERPRRNAVAAFGLEGLLDLVTQPPSHDNTGDSNLGARRQCVSVRVKRPKLET